jgi:hypothetical protein
MSRVPPAAVETFAGRRGQAVERAGERRRRCKFVPARSAFGDDAAITFAGN